QWPVNAIRERTGWVSQSPVLVFGTVLDNLCFGLAEVDKSALEKVLLASGIMCFADRLENGLETQVGELGRNLSGGQRQAVILGRALLRESSLLILDEPCSAMDQTMESQVIAGLKNPPKDRCTVIATHKPSLLQLCDRVIVLDQGRIVADGPTATVLAQQLRDQKTKEKTSVTANTGPQKVRAVNIRRSAVSKREEQVTEPETTGNDS
ncbi:ATP-binding cassette domain-containing protein, partial [Pseudomaricurvus sp.]|uniref:ATP-binding cassette domain-containing protein n=1 Tax=Pseudomaricurvus sp. TaxID=2004510 RepID=UPI003F6AF275